MTLAAPAQPAACTGVPPVSFPATDVRACLRTMELDEVDELTDRGALATLDAVLDAFEAVGGRLPKRGTVSAADAIAATQAVRVDHAEALADAGRYAARDAVVAAMRNVEQAILANAALVARGLPHCLTAGDE